MNRCRFVALLLAFAPVLGCGGSDATPRGTVRGHVTINGKPLLSGATVVYENKTIGVSQTAALDDSGKYEFATHDSVGLPPATYSVTISAGRFMKPGEEIPKVNLAPKGSAPAVPPKKAEIPPKFSKAETSGLTAEVKAGDNAPFDFDLKL